MQYTLRAPSDLAHLLQEVILRGTPGHGFLPAIAMTAPAPGGRGRRPEAGRGGVYRHTWRMETG
ncbi:MAG: hypothetical protein LLF90_12050, partial [Methanomicrobiaceae archaeon]|nr:hypothetical protein [Methanomicrobiaceae archaeon]